MNHVPFENGRMSGMKETMEEDRLTMGVETGGQDVPLANGIRHGCVDGGNA
jgi:hypothetical protein